MDPQNQPPDLARAGKIPLEAAMLLLCARQGLSSEDPARLAALAETSLETSFETSFDWDALLALARAHKLMPVVRRCLATLPAGVVPEVVTTRLEERAAINERRVRSRTAELERLLRLFEAAGLRAIPYKGAALAVYAYGDLLSRSAGDIDLLVSPGDFERALALLIAQGYERGTNFGWETPLSHPKHDAVVDLHNAIREKPVSIRFDFDELWQRSQPIRLADIDARCLSPDDRFLVLCIELVSDCVAGKRQLAKIRDLAQLLERDGESCLEPRLERARQGGGERLVLVSLALVHRTLEVVLPEWVASKIAQSVAVESLARRFAAELFEERRALIPYADRLLVYAGLRERLSDKLATYAEIARDLLRTRRAALWRAGR